MLLDREAENAGGKCPNSPDLDYLPELIKSEGAR
jgi:hypothetical protein